MKENLEKSSNGKVTRTIGTNNKTYEEDKSTPSEGTGKPLFVIGVICFIIQVLAFIFSIVNVSSSESYVGYIDKLGVYDVDTTITVNNSFFSSVTVMIISTIVLGIIAFISKRFKTKDNKPYVLIFFFIIALLGTLYCTLGYACSR